jgi:hypothetical protein
MPHKLFISHVHSMICMSNPALIVAYIGYSLLCNPLGDLKENKALGGLFRL